MAPPPSFITITSIPFSRVVTQAEFNGGVFGGKPNEVWFKFPANGISLIALGAYTNAGGTFLPFTEPYDSDGTTILRSFISQNFGWYTLIDATTDKYIKIRSTPPGTSDFDFTVTFDTKVVNDISSLANGDYFENDDVGGPAVLMGTDGTFKTFISPFSSGEYGALLPNSKSLWDGDAHGSFRYELYDQLSFVTSVNVSAIQCNICASDTHFFLVRHSGEPHTVFRVADDGTFSTLGNLPTLLPNINISGWGCNRAGTIIYWGKQSGDAVIHRWDTTTGLPLSDLYTIPGYDTVNDRFAVTQFSNGGEILCMPDDSLVTWWMDASASFNTNIIHLSNTGTLLHSWPQNPLLPNHLAWIKDSVDTVAVWYFDSSNMVRYGVLNIITGVFTQNFITSPFTGGINENQGNTTIFGPAGSCQFLKLPFGSNPPISPNPGSGIYKVVPGKRNDTLWDDTLTSTFDTKIPNPFARSGLVGE